MEHCVVAFAPGHISGYFRRIDADAATETGSLGAGIVIDRGVTVTMRPASVCSARVESGEHPHLLTDAMQSLGITADITVKADMPIGAGFGMSAAGLLATATAASRLFDLGMSQEDIVTFAHVFEVEHGTGLGDATASADGGIDVRTLAGIRGVTARIADSRPISAVSFGPIDTPAIITSASAMAGLTEAYPSHTPKTLDDVLANSREFAEQSGLITPKVKEVLAACDKAGIPASMTMLGDGVFAIGDTAAAVLEPFGRTYTFGIARHGPVILSSTK